MLAKAILIIGVVSFFPAGIGGESRELLVLRNNQQELNYQLFHIARDFRQVRAMLTDTINHLNDPQYGPDLRREFIPLRLQQIQKSLKTNGMVLVQAHGFCQRILDNDFKDQADLKADFTAEVVRPLAELLKPEYGDLAQAANGLRNVLEAFNKQELEAVALRDSQKKFDQLIKSMEYLVHLTETRGCNSMANMAAEIEREQTILAERLLHVFHSHIGGPLRGVLDPE